MRTHRDLIIWMALWISAGGGSWGAIALAAARGNALAIISGKTAHAAVKEHKLTQILDVRGWLARIRGTIPGAQPIAWQDYSETRSGVPGLLKRLEKVEADFKPYAFKKSAPTLVYGDAGSGWGEEGRVLWMLSLLGFEHLYYLDGGYRAYDRRSSSRWEQKVQGISAKQKSSRLNDPLAGRPFFEVSDLRRVFKQVQFLDVRTRKEFDGAVLYGEAKGGHIPGARHLAFRQFFDEGGRLLPVDTVLAMLRKSGVTLDKPTVVYCTGGVRSALVALLMRSRLGWPVHNYDGSWWEWARATRQN